MRMMMIVGIQILHTKTNENQQTKIMERMERICPIPVHLQMELFPLKISSEILLKKVKF
jgi:ribosome maturation protein Sdo1